jgi:hypothetical protein
MSAASLMTFLPSGAIPGAIKRKAVLLVDASPVKRELRTEAMRRLGMDVDCACDIAEARSWWRADLYALVLINLESGLCLWEAFCSDIRAATPPQKTVFLVGKPGYLAESPSDPGPFAPELDSELEIACDAKPAEAVAPLNSPNVQWGIMEASRRISAVRSVFAARHVALRNRPVQPRDLGEKVPRRYRPLPPLSATPGEEDLL